MVPCPTSRRTWYCAAATLCHPVIPSTSALDLKTEAKLYEALSRDYADVTKIIIAQRIASVQNADRIVVLDGGTIAACGSHRELMASSPIYRDIYDSQLREEATA